MPPTSDASAAVDTHNCYRASVQPPANPPLQPTAWSASLAQGAQTWADRCIFGHSGTPGVGENIAFFSPNDVGFGVVVDAWAAERSNYNHSANTCAAGQVCGHYTQVVWRSSVNLGCAKRFCPSLQGAPGAGYLYVCQYSPQGNFVGQRPY